MLSYDHYIIDNNSQSSIEDMSLVKDKTGMK